MEAPEVGAAGVGKCVAPAGVDDASQVELAAPFGQGDERQVDLPRLTLRPDGEGARRPVGRPP